MRMFLIFTLFVFPVVAVAAPTVKKLGTNTPSVTASVSAGSAMPARAASTRFDTAKPVTKANPAVATTSKSSGNAADNSRLSVGKYMQVVHSIKPEATAGSGTPGISSGEAVALKDEITSTTHGLREHVENTDVHVSASEKETWNEKQDSLTAGDGITIEDSVISSVMNLPVGSENGPRTAPMWIE